MDTIQLLENRAIEMIRKVLNDAISPARTELVAGLRLDLALFWDNHEYDMPSLFHALYLSTIVTRIVGNPHSTPPEYSHYRNKLSAEHAADQIAAISDTTENPFFAPMIVFAANQIDWDVVAAGCIDSFFSPQLMGQFSSPSEAIEYYENEDDEVRCDAKAESAEISEYDYDPSSDY